MKAFRTLLLLSSLAPVLPAAGATGGALPYSHNIPLLSPKPDATVEWASAEEVVTFSFHVDDNAVLAEAARTGDHDGDRCGVEIAFFLKCEGAGCKAGPGGSMSVINRDNVAVRVGALLDLTNGDPAAPHVFLWGAQLGYKKNERASPPCISVAIAATEARFTLVRKAPPAGPPDLALSLAPDRPDAWPKTLTVSSTKGPSKATFLVVSVKTVSPADAVVRKYCSIMDVVKTHTVDPLAGGGAKRTFDVPALAPSQAQTQALLHALPPPAAAAAGPTPTKAPLKAGLQPTLTAHDPNVHEVVTCQYLFDAKLGTDTNEKDPNKQNNHLSRTIRIDVPMN